jgi:dihydrodipicolinate reductase
MTPARAKGLTVAVTGPTGEIGQAVVAALERSSEVSHVLGMARRPFEPAERDWKKVSYRRGDLSWRPRHNTLQTLRETIAATRTESSVE